jgi:iron complex outermembrane receptor protein
MKIQGMRGLLLASTVFGGTLTAMTLAAAPAMAQQKPAAAEPSAVEEIVVTGSRIRRTDTETPEPVGVVSAEAVKERGFINIADAINDLPQARGSQTTRPGRASQGAAAGRDFISLFNLGSQRTLTLVNGRRFVGSNPAGAGAGGNQVDINNIPTGLVDRVETVQATGGAVYGSDAIAGVVNIILKKNYEGLEIDGQTGISDRGDYRRQLGRVTAGKNFLDGRANVAINLEYSKTDSLNGNERKATDRSYTNATNPKNTSNTDGIPNLILIQDWRVPEASAGGLVFTNTGSALTGLVKVNGSPVTFGPGGVLVPYKVGTVYGPTTAGGDSDGVNFADHITLITGSERYNATLLGRYDLTDNIHLSTELLASKLKAREPTNQNISNVNFSTGASGGITLSLDNAFLQPAARAALIGAGITNTFDISRWHEDIGTALTNDSNTYRALVGLDGDFKWADRNFYWNASFSRGKSKGTTESNDIYQQRWLYSIDSVANAGGAPVCRVTRDNPTSTDANIRNCVPINLFGVGAPSQAALDYVLLKYTTEFQVDQTDGQANFGGDLVKLPAGNLSFVAGWEYRKDQSAYNPDARAIAGIGRSLAATAINGEYHTNEFYGEGVAPILGGDFNPIPFVTKAEVTGSYRRVDNSLAGKNNAWSYGGRLTVFNDLTLRATKSKTFRAPNLFELFLPQTTGQGSPLPDPCDVGNILSGNVPAVRQANCAKSFQALGLPANFQLSSDQRTTRNVITGGNPNLKNEVADNWTVGFVYQPHFVQGLTFTADWVKIDVTNAITNFNLPAVLQACYDSPTASPFCGNFTRNAQGNVNPGALTGYSNAGYLKFEAETYQIDYDVPLQILLPMFDEPGHLNVALNALHTTRQNTSASGLGFDVIRNAGTTVSPEWEGQVNFRYIRGPLRVNWNVQYTDKTLVNLTDTLEQRDVLGFDAYIQHDVSVQYQFNDKITGRVVVQNLFDAQPPYGTAAIGDIIGRYYFVGLNYRF